MQISVYQDQTLIGIACLKHLDAPMGVAFGPFMPSHQYDRDKHANVIDGKYIDDKGKSLSAQADQGSALNAAVGIEDCTDPEIGKHITVFFQDGHDFAALFSEHPDYKAYYAR